MQAKVAPAARGCDEGGSEFITEAQRRHDVAISGAGMSITASGRVERRHMAGASGQQLKLVHIVMAELIVNELIGHIDEWIFGERAGEVMGESPTGREVRLRGVNIFRIADGKIVERWGRLDDIGLLQQLGLSPQPAEAN
jgi:hypothetical protein